MSFDYDQVQGLLNCYGAIDPACATSEDSAIGNQIEVGKFLINLDLDFYLKFIIQYQKAILIYYFC